MENFKNAFREEAWELLTELEAALLELEDAPEDLGIIGRVFRAMHTIKGSGAMFGFDDVASFSHEIENLLDRVRQGQVSVTKPLINMTLSACDQVRQMVEGSNIDEAKKEEILTACRELNACNAPDLTMDEDSISSDNPFSGSIEKSDAVGPEVTYRIRFKPDAGLFASGTDPNRLIEELAELGQIAVTAQTNRVPLLQEMDPEACYLFWDITLTTNKGLNAVEDVFIFVADEAELAISVVDEDVFDAGLESYKKLGEILLERGDVRQEDLKLALGRQRPVGTLLQDVGAVDDALVRSALAEQQQVRENRQKRIRQSSTASIRVAADKLDTLVDLVGELVTIQASLSQAALNLHSNELDTISEQVERLTAELRDNTMSIRMVPIGTTFSKFKRLVHDLSDELGKEVGLVMSGGETELDKTVIDRLNDPLIHIIRNSLDHGIETPDRREQAGKPSQGTITLSAAHAGASVLIRIEDDGAGLDVTAIRDKAIKNGLITPDEEKTDKELFQLIFEPGFSTARAVTDVSGRGVGMDVVKRSIEDLRGFIDITSQKGKGTTITLRLPLTLAIIDGLQVKIGNSSYIFPLATVEECIELSRVDMAKNNGRRMVEVRGQAIPFIPLRDLFHIHGTAPDIQRMAICDVDGLRIGFVVDSVIGRHQTVIKSLGPAYRDVKEFSGATILPNGNVALIIDVGRALQASESKE